MHRLAARTVTVVSLAALLASASFPALAKSPHPERRGGKKAIGEVVSFDAATAALVVELTDGEELTASVDPDAQVKLEHRGRHRGEGHGNPGKGSLADLVAGAKVLRLKFEDELVTKIRLRPAPATALPELPAEDDSTDDTADAAPGDDSAGAADDVEEDDIDDEDDTDTPDDDPSGDVEDALPPLPVTQP